MSSVQRIGLIGYGAIARAAVAVIRHASTWTEVAAVLLRPGRSLAASHDVPPNCRIVETVQELLAYSPDAVFECASHEAVRDYGEPILATGTDLTVISVGALADAALLHRLTGAAADSGAALVIPAGAVAGIDALAAARLAGLDSVTHIVEKPALAWKGTAAEKVADLDSLREPTTLFEGSAGAAAQLYPLNANVTATIALAGLGFERTMTHLIAIPRGGHNLHRIEARGCFGSLSITMHGQPMPHNPKTSMLAALSVARAMLLRGSVMRV